MTKKISPALRADPLYEEGVLKFFSLSKGRCHPVTEGFKLISRKVGKSEVESRKSKRHSGKFARIYPESRLPQKLPALQPSEGFGTFGRFMGK
jgi:hypothetical protein